MSSVIALGLDPGFASLGYALVCLLPDGKRELVKNKMGGYVFGVWETEKSDKKRAVKASDDNVRRTRELARLMFSVMAADYDIKVVCAESMSFPRNSSSAQKMGLGWGAIATAIELLNLPIVQSSPQEIKTQVCGKKDASKQEIQEALSKQYGLDLDQFPKTSREHCFDALGAVEAAVDTEFMRLACRMAKAG